MSHHILYERMSYITDDKYKNGIIREYDLSKANISALRSLDVIDDKTYQDLYNANKNYREVKIGMMIKKDKNIYQYIKKGITDAKKQFFTANNIKDHEVIAIHNDSVIINAQRQFVDTFGLYHFVIKGEYTQFFRDFNKTEYYYAHNLHTNEDIFTVKGISQETLNSRPQEFLKFLIDIFYMVQTNNILEVLEYYNSYVQKYINMELPLESYRELNSENGFRINVKTAKESYYLDYITHDQLYAVEKNFNFGILRDIGQVLYDIYFSYIQNRRRGQN